MGPLVYFEVFGHEESKERKYRHPSVISSRAVALPVHAWWVSSLLVARLGHSDMVPHENIVAHAIAFAPAPTALLLITLLGPERRKQTNETTITASAARSCLGPWVRGLTIK